MQIDNKHELYNKFAPLWEKTRDAYDGEDQVKSKNTKYLKKLSGQDSDSYDAYLDRARYTNYVGRTIDVALGQLFRKTPVLIDVDDDVKENTDLSGKSFFYYSKDLARELFQTNRVGIMVDYSEQLQRPYATRYRAEEIINWDTQIIEGIEQLNLVVLEGSVNISEDVFKTKSIKMWRVLILEDNIYYVRDYIKEELTGDFILKNEYIPRASGQPLNFIPFYFQTSDGLSFDLNNPPALDLANVNLGHYKNSADYENMLHETGAKTYVLKEWNHEQIFPIGGTASFPENGGAEILEASSDSGLKDELRHKEEQMSAMGTSIISGRGRYVQSAETARTSSQGEYATLAEIANAMSTGMTKILRVMALWQGQDESNISVEYNKDYELQDLDPTTLTAFIGAVQGGYMSFETYYYNMKNKEVYPEDWSLEDELAAIEARQEVVEIEDDSDQPEDSEQVEDNELG